MNGTIERWLQGSLVTLGLALACAGVGCVTPDDPDTDTDTDAEQIGEAAQQLDEIDAPPPPEGQDATGAPNVDESAVNDSDGGEPQPVPWLVYVGSPVPDVDPTDPLGAPHPGAPSSNNSGK